MEGMVESKRKRKRDCEANDEELITKRRHTEETTVKREVNDEEVYYSDGVDTSSVEIPKVVDRSGWHKARHQDLLNDVMREHDSEEDEEEDFEEEGDLAELHKEFVTLASHYEQLRERCDRDWKKGRWSVQEINKLKHNVRLFMKKNQITDLPAFIFEKQQTIKRIDMFRFVAKGIRRPLFLIYRKIARIFNAENYVGRWTEDMDKKLLELHKIHGSKWAQMAPFLGVSCQSARDRYRIIHKASRNKGAWTLKEEELLATAVNQIRGEDWTGGDSELPDTASWKDVAEYVNTRTAIQCWNKWVQGLSWKEDGVSTRNLWTVSNDVTLIERLNTLEAEDEEEVDWTELAKEWPQLASDTNTRVRYLLRTKWNILRRSVPQYIAKTFQENLDYLVQYKLPILKSKVKPEQDNSDR